MNSQETEQSTIPDVSLSKDISDREQQMTEDNPAQDCGNSNDMEARCGKPCSSTTNDDSVAELENDITLAPDQLKASCYSGVSLMSMNHVSAADNASTKMSCVTYHRREQQKTYSRQRSKDSDSSVMNSLSIQAGEDNTTEDSVLDHSINDPSISSSKNTFQKKVATEDGASEHILEDMILDKYIDVCSDFVSQKKSGMNGVQSGEEVSAIDAREESIDQAKSDKLDDTKVEMCHVHNAKNNLDKSTHFGDNNATYDATDGSACDSKLDERRPDNLEEVASLSSEINAQHRNENTKLPIERTSICSNKKKLLVLDVNGLLADIVPVAYVSDKFSPATYISGKAVFKRPFCDEFLDFCFERFSVGVWSSRTKRNVDSVLDFLMGKLRHNLLFCWDQSHCTHTRYNTRENKNKPLVFKNLAKLWEKSEPDLPWKRGEYDESNTVLLDDSPYKALLNPPNTAIFPYSYQYRDERDNSLGPGGDLRIYLEGLAMAETVQEYVKQNPFGQPPITEKDASWSFYLEVIESSVVGPLSSQSAESSLKALKDVPVVDMTSVAAGTSEECIDNNIKNQEHVKIGSSHAVVQNIYDLRDVGSDSRNVTLKQNTIDCDSSDPPCSIQRHSKRDKSERTGRSHRSGTSRSRSQSRSLSPKRYRRSRSPSHWHRSGGYKARMEQTKTSECLKFLRGNCYRGASCWYIHHEPDNAARSRSYRINDQSQDNPSISKTSYELDKTGRSRSYRIHDQNQDNPPISKTSDVYRNNDVILSDRSVDQQNESKMPHSKEDIPVMEERVAVKEELDNHTNLSDKMRRDKALPEYCRKFIRGYCYKGATCQYLHYEPYKTDRSRTYGSKQPYQDLKTSETFRNTEGTSFHENDWRKFHNLEQYIMAIKGERGIREELSRSSSHYYDTTRRYKTLAPECIDFSRGKCHRGANCRYVHEGTYMTDRSRDDSHYWQYHDGSVPSRSSNIYSGAGRIPLVRSVYEHSEPRSEQCYDFTRGKCHRGAYCRYLHHEPYMSGSRSWSQLHYQDVQHCSTSSDVYGDTQSIPPKSSVHEHNEPRTQARHSDCL